MEKNANWREFHTLIVSRQFAPIRVFFREKTAKYKTRIGANWGNQGRILGYLLSPGSSKNCTHAGLPSIKLISVCDAEETKQSAKGTEKTTKNHRAKYSSHARDPENSSLGSTKNLISNLAQPRTSLKQDPHTRRHKNSSPGSTKN